MSILTHPKAKPLPRALSPSSLALWEKDREAWTVRYFTPRPNDPQTPAMAVGTWFDVLIKERIASDYGISFDLAGLYGSIENKDKRAEDLGREIYAHYIKSGAYSTLCVLMGSEVVMEGDETAIIRGVPIRGKPDLAFLTPKGVRVVLDWKCNGIYGNPISPTAGYVDSFPSRKPHPKCLSVMDDGVLVNIESTPRPHEEQLIIYDLLLGGNGAGIQIIDQVTTLRGELRTTRCAYRVTEAAVGGLLDRYVGMWENICKGRIFTDLSPEEDSLKQDALLGPTGKRLF